MATVNLKPTTPAYQFEMVQCSQPHNAGRNRCAQYRSRLGIRKNRPFCTFPLKKIIKGIKKLPKVIAFSHLSIADAAARVRSEVSMACLATPTYTCASVCLPSCLLSWLTLPRGYAPPRSDQPEEVWTQRVWIANCCRPDTTRSRLQR